MTDIQQNLSEERYGRVKMKKREQNNFRYAYFT